MQIKNYDPSKIVVLTEEEQRILDSLPDNPSFVSSNDKERLLDAVHYTKELEERKQISIRLPKKDIIGMKKRAKKSGIPYQSIISSLIHQYLEGSIEVKI